MNPRKADPELIRILVRYDIAMAQSDNLKLAAVIREKEKQIKRLEAELDTILN